MFTKALIGAFRTLNNPVFPYNISAFAASTCFPVFLCKSDCLVVGENYACTIILVKRGKLKTSYFYKAPLKST